MEANILALLQSTPADKSQKTQTKHQAEYSKKQFPLNKVTKAKRPKKVKGMNNQQRQALASDISRLAEIEKTLIDELFTEKDLISIVKLLLKY
jgi:hypothetical protein